MSGKAVRETLGFLGVMASMVFVGMEIRQNTAVARAEVRREMAAQNIEMVTRTAEDEKLTELERAVWTLEYYESLSANDQQRVFLKAIALTLRLESVYLQYEEGLLDQIAFGAYGMFQPHLREPWFRGFWSFYRTNLDPDFVRYFEDVNGYTP